MATKCSSFRYRNHNRHPYIFLLRSSAKSSNDYDYPFFLNSTDRNLDLHQPCYYLSKKLMFFLIETRYVSLTNTVGNEKEDSSVTKFKINIRIRCNFYFLTF